MSRISISGLKKEDVLAALYNAGGHATADMEAAAKTLRKPLREPMTSEDAKRIIDSKGLRFDYLGGVALKVDLEHDDVWVNGYDSRHGQGAFAAVIGELRMTGDVRVTNFADRMS